MAHGTNIPLHRTKAPKENEDCRLCSATLSTPGVQLMLFRRSSVSSPLCLANQPPRSVGTQPARFAPPFPGTHAKHRRDQERIVNFQIGRTQLARPGPYRQYSATPSASLESATCESLVSLAPKSLHLHPDGAQRSRYESSGNRRSRSLPKRGLQSTRVRLEPRYLVHEGAHPPFPSVQYAYSVPFAKCFHSLTESQAGEKNGRARLHGNSNPTPNGAYEKRC